jgi:hypothetical protein
MYQCPSTGMNAEVWYEIDDDPSERTNAFFETVACIAYGQVHLVDPKSGQVVGTRRI